MNLISKVSRVRCYDSSSHDNRCYIELENNGKKFWGYIVPNNDGAKIIVQLAILAFTNKCNVFVSGRQQKDNKLEIYELGVE